MINVSDAYKTAIVADKRRIIVNALARIIDSDIVYTGAETNSELYSGENTSKLYQLYDENLNSGDCYAALEQNRWVLDGTFSPFGTPLRLVSTEVGYVSGVVSDENGEFGTQPYAKITFSGIDNLQGCGVQFSNREYDGYAVDFTVQLLSGTTVLYTTAITGNTALKRNIFGFNVNNPTAIKITVNKWSLPCRRARIIEIYAGGLENWTNDNILDFDIVEETDLSNQSLPNGECKIEIYDNERLYSPETPSLYNMLEERQSVDVSIGAVVDDTTVKYVPMYKHYIRYNGWEQSEAAKKIKFELTDLIGLVKDREFVVPATLPTTVSGWMAAVLGALGTKFETKYIIDSGITSALGVASADDIKNKKCGDMLKWIAQATLGYIRCDKTTGYIHLSPWPTSSGILYSLDNQSDYSDFTSRGGIAYFKFKYGEADGGGEYTIDGTRNASDKDITINNPFVRPNTIAHSIITNLQKCYDTSEITVKGRGNPETELGDINTVVMWPEYSKAAYLISQNIKVKSGVMDSTSKLWAVKT